MEKFRTITKSVKVNSVELKKIKSAASKSGMGWSTYVRSAALEKIKRDS